MVKVSFQGERGAYSEEAIYEYFGERVEVVPLPTMHEVFKSVENGFSDYAVVPVENSLEGSVGEVLDLLLETNLKVCGEIILRIIHCLICNPGEELRDIKVIYSHPQALGQSRNFIRRLGCKALPVYDTAGSVKMIKGVKGAAAIASERAAKIYGMKILVKGVEDNPNNYTRFLVLSNSINPPTGKDKTSIIFAVKHVPGALYSALGVFAERNINLTKIESRPSRKRLWEYNFYVDFEGHVEDEFIKDALKALKSKTTFIKVLGSYPKFTESHSVI